MEKPDIKRHEWRSEKISNEYWLVTPLDAGDGMYKIATIHGADHNSLKDTAQAISAVPEMIDALIDARNIIKDLLKDADWTKDEYYKEDLQEIESALKKAGCTE